MNCNVNYNLRPGHSCRLRRELLVVGPGGLGSSQNWTGCMETSCFYVEIVQCHDNCNVNYYLPPEGGLVILLVDISSEDSRLESQLYSQNRATPMVTPELPHHYRYTLQYYVLGQPCSILGNTVHNTTLVQSTLLITRYYSLHYRGGERYVQQLDF